MLPERWYACKDRSISSDRIVVYTHIKIKHIFVEPIHPSLRSESNMPTIIYEAFIIFYVTAIKFTSEKYVRSSTVKKRQNTVKKEKDVFEKN